MDARTHRKSIAVVAYNWPPRNASGVHRPYSWAKYWSARGHRVTVITAAKQSFDAPLDLELPRITGVEVIEVEFGRTFGMVGKSVSLQTLRALKRFIARRFRINVDVRDAWAKAARRVAERVAASSEVIVSTHGPRAAHLIGFQMKQANPRALWIADYRDPWSGNHLADWTPGARLQQRALELRTVGRSADVVTTVSEAWAEDLRRLLGRPTYVIANGADFSEDDLRQGRGARRGSQDPLCIVHTGMIYEGRRDPTPLLAAIRHLIESGAVSPGRFRVDFFGARVGDLPALIAKTRSAAFAHIRGHAEHREAVAAQRRAGILLLLESGAPDALGVVPAKVFEYMAAGVPILAVGPDKGGAIARILEDTGTGICAGNQIERIKAALLEALQDAGPAWYRPRIERIMRFSRRVQAERLLDLIASHHTLDA